MKRSLAFLALGSVLLGANAATPSARWTRDDFRIRDPFVLAENGTYYLYESKPWSGGHGVDVRMSTDLEHWTDRQPAMQLPSNVACTAVWAPEVHKYKGAYWLFTTLTFAATNAAPYLKPIRPMTEKGFAGSALLPRGVWVFRAERPTGPFAPVKIGSVTPAEWMCLDGTLWVEDGIPWMVFCHEWCQTGNGRMMAAPLSEDLASFASAPIELFRAANALPGAGCVTDGPFLTRTKEAGLRMIWSNSLKGKGYCVIQCTSPSGKVAGPWIEYRPLYTKDGGHGMVFRRFDGRPVLTLHQPNSSPKERMKLFPLRISSDGFSLGD